jgi:hypothetical protein
MRLLIALASGIGGLLCLMAVMGGFRPAGQTIVIGFLLLLIAYVVTKLGRRRGGGGSEIVYAPPITDRCPGSGQQVPIRSGDDGATLRNCPHCRLLTLATPAGVILEHNEYHPPCRAGTRRTGADHEDIASESDADTDGESEMPRQRRVGLKLGSRR